jgi:Phage-related tail fibre protein
MATVDSSINIAITTIGAALKQNAVLDGNAPIDIKYFAVGDANGAATVTLDDTQTRLINEVWRGKIVSLQNLEGTDEGSVLLTAYIPADECAATYLKEFGLFDATNRLIFIGKLGDLYKPGSTSTGATPVLIQLKIVWGYSRGLSLESSDEFTYATRADLPANSSNMSNQTGSNSGASYIYFMGGENDSAQTSPTGSTIYTTVKTINTVYDLTDIDSGDFLIVTSAMTLKLPIVDNGIFYVKRMYEGDDLILTTEDTDLYKIEGETSIAITTNKQVLTLVCDGTNFYLG